MAAHGVSRERLYGQAHQADDRRDEPPGHDFQIRRRQENLSARAATTSRSRSNTIKCEGARYSCQAGPIAAVSFSNGCTNRPAVLPWRMSEIAFDVSLLARIGRPLTGFPWIFQDCPAQSWESQTKCREQVASVLSNFPGCSEVFAMRAPSSVKRRVPLPRTFPAAPSVLRETRPTTPRQQPVADPPTFAADMKTSRGQARLEDMKRTVAPWREPSRPPSSKSIQFRVVLRHSASFCVMRRFVPKSCTHERSINVAEFCVFCVADHVFRAHSPPAVSLSSN
jgi:hypothetical protein